MQEPIDEAYFTTICEKLPFLRKLREEQESMGNNYFALLIHFFKKFSQLESELHLEKDPQKRYELLFNIIDMGNLIKAMRLIERCKELETQTRNTHDRDDIQICGKFLLTLNQYRNVVADGYHAYSSKTSTDIIPLFRHFFSELSASEPTYRFSQNRKTFRESMFDIKNEFRHVNTQDDIFSFISSDGNKEDEKTKICTLLEGIKYFLDKSALLYQDGKKDCASLYFIAAANCARDMENYYLVKTMRTERRSELTPDANIKFYATRRNDQHTHNLLTNLRMLRQDRGQQFAHKVGPQKEVTERAMQKKISNEPNAKAYISGIYNSLDTYLEREYGIPPKMANQVGSIKVTDDSPRAYPPLPRLRTIVNAQRHLVFEEAPRPPQSSQGEKRRRDENYRTKEKRPDSDRELKKNREGRSPTRK